MNKYVLIIFQSIMFVVITYENTTEMGLQKLCEWFVMVISVRKIYTRKKVQHNLVLAMACFGLMSLKLYTSSITVKVATPSNKSLESNTGTQMSFTFIFIYLFIWLALKNISLIQGRPILLWQETGKKTTTIRRFLLDSMNWGWTQTVLMRYSLVIALR